MLPAFGTLASRTVVLRQRNIDTDQIIPARFLTTTERQGLGKHAFNDWRYAMRRRRRPTRTSPSTVAENAGAQHPASPATTSAAAPRASTRRGRWPTSACARWSAAEIADIFRSNALKNGLLPVALDEAVVQAARCAPRRSS